MLILCDLIIIGLRKPMHFISGYMVRSRIWNHLNQLLSSLNFSQEIGFRSISSKIKPPKLAKKYGIICQYLEYLKYSNIRKNSTISLTSTNQHSSPNLTACDKNYDEIINFYFAIQLTRKMFQLLLIREATTQKNSGWEILLFKGFSIPSSGSY